MMDSETALTVAHLVAAAAAPWTMWLVLRYRRLLAVVALLDDLIERIEDET